MKLVMAKYKIIIFVKAVPVASIFKKNKAVNKIVIEIIAAATPSAIIISLSKPAFFMFASLIAKIYVPMNCLNFSVRLCP